ncbi:MAG TPA: condensation domain-containing protein, partial [Thermoanaerobaculia bacterium]|nr:condensation domain-containing protein [Thermoanaerobaculia bacterium]
MTALAEKRAILERLLRQKMEQPKTASLSFAQERLWFLDQLVPGSSVYNITRAIALDGPLDFATLARAAAGVVRRHEALRTTFRADRADTERPLQVVAPQLALNLPLIDLSGLPPERRQETAAALSRQAAVLPFDLTRGPLLRLRLLRLAAERHRLLATFHHIVFDGGSFGVFFRELSALYRGNS